MMPAAIHERIAAAAAMAYRFGTVLAKCPGRIAAAVNQVSLEWMPTAQ